MATRQQSTRVEIMFPDDAEAFIAQHREGTFTLLDVRQSAEYETGHLPGATLIPLPLLADSLEELDPSKPVIAYCALGGRSRMAAHLMSHQGFREVYQLEGGMEAWEGRAAEGPREFHLQFVRGDETVQEVIALAYSMEKGLRGFHQAARSRASDPAVAKLLKHLINAEEGHMRRLREVSSEWDLSSEEMEAFQEGLDTTIMEGGVNVDEFLKENESFLETVIGVVDLAMMLETQALDLYLRMAAESKNAATQKILFEIAEEEKAHLRALGTVLEGHLSGPASST